MPMTLLSARAARGILVQGATFRCRFPGTHVEGLSSVPTTCATGFCRFSSADGTGLCRVLTTTVQGSGHFLTGIVRGLLSCSDYQNEVKVCCHFRTTSRKDLFIFFLLEYHCDDVCRFLTTDVKEFRLFPFCLHPLLSVCFPSPFSSIPVLVLPDSLQPSISSSISHPSPSPLCLFSLPFFLSLNFSLTAPPFHHPHSLSPLLFPCIYVSVHQISPRQGHVRNMHQYLVKSVDQPTTSAADLVSLRISGDKSNVPSACGSSPLLSHLFFLSVSASGSYMMSGMFAPKSLSDLCLLTGSV